MKKHRRSADQMGVILKPPKYTEIANTTLSPAFRGGGSASLSCPRVSIRTPGPGLRPPEDKPGWAARSEGARAERRGDRDSHDPVPDQTAKPDPRRAPRDSASQRPTEASPRPRPPWATSHPPGGLPRCTYLSTQPEAGVACQQIRPPAGPPHLSPPLPSLPFPFPFPWAREHARRARPPLRVPRRPAGTRRRQRGRARPRRRRRPGALGGALPPKSVLPVRWRAPEGRGQPGRQEAAA
ncbi:hypothetical protein H8959_010989 [Pygathrix nigripes]